MQKSAFFYAGFSFSWINFINHRNNFREAKMAQQYLITLQTSPGFEDEAEKLGNYSNEIKMAVDNSIPSVHVFCSIVRMHNQELKRSTK